MRARGSMSEIVLNVPDISCDHCARTINQTLSPLAGVRRVDVDVPGKRVRLEYDEDRPTWGRSAPRSTRRAIRLPRADAGAAPADPPGGQAGVPGERAAWAAARPGAGRAVVARPRRGPAAGPAPAGRPRGAAF